jgi:hypothetical protein
VDGRPQQSAQALNTELGNKDQELACHPDGLNGLPILLVREACRSEGGNDGHDNIKASGLELAGAKSLGIGGSWADNLPRLRPEFSAATSKCHPERSEGSAFLPHMEP